MRFEDLDVWKRASRLSAEIFKFTRKLKDLVFRDQLCKAALSIPSNIAEGFERESAKECVNFLSYAKGSSGELRTQIYIGIEISYIPKEQGADWVKETKEISSMLNGLIRTKRKFK